MQVAQDMGPQPAGVSLVRDPKGLHGFLDPACAVALWQRDIPTRVRDWLEQLDPGCLPRGRVILQTEGIADTALQLCEISGLPDGPERDWLIGDIAGLAAAFAQLMQASYLRLRLDVVTTNACRKFHLDALRGRLVCTYRGTGTQYGYAGDGRAPEHIFTAATGAPILLRGTLWPPEPPAGVLHRSPPIEGTGETRLVLVLDPVFDPENEV